MKKFFILILLVCISSIQLYSQLTGLETPPPNDPSCYSNLEGCTSWSSWSNWKSITFPSGLNDCQPCSLYVNYTTRYCLTDPSIVELWIGAFGVDPMIGCPCSVTIAALLSDPTKWQMICYRKIAYAEFETVKMQNCCSLGDPPCCANTGVMHYSMRWPGSCTMNCIYSSTPNGALGSKWLVTGDYACYTSQFCCGKTYLLCYDCTNQQIVEYNEITIGAGHSCDYPTGNCPDYLCPTQNGWYKQGCTGCKDNCEYSNQ